MFSFLKTSVRRTPARAHTGRRILRMESLEDRRLLAVAALAIDTVQATAEEVSVVFKYDVNNTNKITETLTVKDSKGAETVATAVINSATIGPYTGRALTLGDLSPGEYTAVLRVQQNNANAGGGGNSTGEDWAAEQEKDIDFSIVAFTFTIAEMVDKADWSVNIEQDAFNVQKMGSINVTATLEDDHGYSEEIWAAIQFALQDTDNFRLTYEGDNGSVTITGATGSIVDETLHLTFKQQDGTTVTLEDFSATNAKQGEGSEMVLWVKIYNEDGSAQWVELGSDLVKLFNSKK